MKVIKCIFYNMFADKIILAMSFGYVEMYKHCNGELYASLYDTNLDMSFIIAENIKTKKELVGLCQEYVDEIRAASDEK